MKYVKKKLGKFMPSKEMKKQAWVTEEIYSEAVNQIKFWDNLAKNGISWDKKWKKTYEEKFPFFKWFLGGKLNVCYNALDRHIKEGKGDKTALIFVPEPINESPLVISYSELHEKVNHASAMLKKLGVKKGDVVSIYLPMIPEIIISILACARIGAVHNVVFSAFSSNALKTRILDGKPKLLITADGYYRRGKVINLKEAADEAVKGTSVKKVVIVRRIGRNLKLKKNQYWWHKCLVKKSVNPVSIESNDPLFILYTSGTTGKPKGVVHSAGGYAVQTYYTAKWLFNLHDDDIIWCTADIGWITGHSYVCYGPLMNNSTTLVYEGSPDYPDFSRFWEIIEKYKVTVFYTAPTALRMFMMSADKLMKKYKMPSLKILGTVGEPIDKDTWLWYFKKVGKKRCPVLDTYWQTETGGIVFSSLPGAGPFIPTFTGKSFPGINHTILTEEGEPVKQGQVGWLAQKPPFAPAMLSGLWKNPKLYKEKYFPTNKRVYFTGDGAYQDKKGNFRITGRLDDVIKVAGHRLSTAEIENELDALEEIKEAAVIGKPDKLRGEVPIAFVISDPITLEKINAHIRKAIGPIAKIEEVYFVNDLPKTRSGKIMRRILKSLTKKEKLGDLSTLMNPECVKKIESILKK
jgi:acetyl-CoA synthetase